MPAEAFRALVERVAAFYVTDKAMSAAQRRAEGALTSGDISAEERRAYVRELVRYFSPFEREARKHLRDLDRRLEHANQVVFNLTAERAVAVKRIDATHGVLESAAALEGRAST